MAQLRIFTDFDGTISQTDSLVWLLDRYIGPSWLEIEERVENGSLSEEEGLRAEVSLLKAPLAQARDLVLAHVPLDPSFAGFASYCRSRDWPLEIISGGLAPLIRALLARAGLADLPLACNDLAFDEDGHWRVVPASSPRINELCNHCKSHWLVAAKRAGERIVYIGDGTTDRCPAGHADLLFAKGGLREWCARRSLPHQPFEHFAGIHAWFETKAGRQWLAG